MKRCPSSSLPKSAAALTACKGWNTENYGAPLSDADFLDAVCEVVKESGLTACTVAGADLALSLADFAIGSPGSNGGRGSVYIVYGRRDFPSEVALADLASSGLGCKLVGHSSSSTPGAPVGAEASGYFGGALDVVRYGGGSNAGSGGGIRLDVQTLSGVGEISANGGTGIHDGGSGSGGRVAVYYTTLSGFDLGKVTANGGVHANGLSQTEAGTA